MLYWILLNEAKFDFGPSLYLTVSKSAETLTTLS